MIAGFLAALVQYGRGMADPTSSLYFNVKGKEPDALSIPGQPSGELTRTTDDWMKRNRTAQGPQTSRVAIPSSLAVRPNLLRPLLGTSIKS